jgi:outer membrane autotransporter protein
MTRSLFAAAALGPICLALAVPAHAATVSTARITPIGTSSAGTAGAEDVAITTDGSVKLTTPGTAVILDSNNSVSNAGTIQFDEANNATGIGVLGGFTGTVTNTGAINLIETFTPSDANSDGIYEAPLASGGARYGVRVIGAAPFTGSLINGGVISIEGNDSAGVSVEAPLVGGIVHSGSIGVTGDRSFGIRTTAPISGDISLTGATGAAGQGSVAVSIGGDVGGAVKLYSSVSTNAYSNGVRSTVADTLKTIQATASETQQAGAALVVGADVAGGVYIGAAPAGTDTTNTTADNDADGIADNVEGSGSVSVFGLAPGILIGGANRNVSIGAFGGGANAYGLIVRGAVNTNGLYDGVTATGIQIGGVGGTASLAGGMRLVGTVSATAYEANSTGLRIGAGGAVPEFRNENTLSASLLNSIASGATASTATAVLVEAGGSLTRLTNIGVINAGAVGPSVNASAVVDRSGTLSSIDNQGAITAALTPAATGDPTGGRTIALDLAANTSGVTLVQNVNASPILLASGFTTPLLPSITGDVLLGSGPNKVSILAGTLTGALDMGSGASALSIGGGAVYTGRLSHAGSNLAVEVTSGSLINTSAKTLGLTSLSVGASGTLSFAVDPLAGTATRYDVSGAASFASGAKIGVNLLSPLLTNQTYTLVSSPQLTLGSLSSLQAETPYAIIAALNLNSAAGSLNLDLRRRSAAEAGFDAAQAAAYDAISTNLPTDSAVQSALFTPQDRAGFVGVYNQLLPDYAGGTFRLASLASRAVNRAAAEGGAGGAWVQEITVGARLQSGQGGQPYRAFGFGLAGGLERESRIGVLGLKASFVTGDSRDTGLPGDNKSTVTDLGGGLYWRAALGGLTFDAGAGGGYVRSTYRRQLVITDSAGTATLTRTAEAKSSGWSADARAGVAYQADFGGLYLRPQAHVDWYRLDQGAYDETGGGAGLNLSVDSRTGHEASGTASIVLGAKFGQTTVWRPELEVGYRRLFSSDTGTIAAHFAGGPTFSVYALGLEEGGPMARLSLKAGGETYDFSFGAGVEKRSGYLEGDLHVKARLQF